MTKRKLLRVEEGCSVSLFRPEKQGGLPVSGPPYDNSSRVPAVKQHVQVTVVNEAIAEKVEVFLRIVRSYPVLLAEDNAAFR